MSGEHELQALLQNMSPEMHNGVFVFCSLPKGQKIPAGISPIQIFQELEGTTLIVRQEEAEKAELPYQFPSRQITLMIHSSLAAVGFLAAITAQLARHDISVNAISAFYHDHIFVPCERADEALQLLHELSRSKSKVP